MRCGGAGPAQRPQQQQQRRRAPAVAAHAAAAPRVVATREQGKNGKLISGLEKHGISCIELPLIEHAPGPDRWAPRGVRSGSNSWPGFSPSCTRPFQHCAAAAANA